MIFKVVTCFKFVFHIAVDVFQEVIAFNLLSKTVSICGEKLCTISIFRFDLVVVKVVHQRFANIEDAHSEVDFFMWISVTFSSNMVHRLRFGFAASFNAFMRFLTYLIFTFFLMFSIVFPQTEMFIGLRKFFSKSFFHSRVTSC